MVLALNLVNPHDVMFYNTDAPGSPPAQDTRHLMNINREPAHALYQKRWNMSLPASRHEPWDYDGRPRAHYEYQFSRQTLVGRFPNEDARWKRLQDYYLNLAWSMPCPGWLSSLKCTGLENPLFHQRSQVLGRDRSTANGASTVRTGELAMIRSHHHDGVVREPELVELSKDAVDMPIAVGDTRVR